MEQVTNPVQKSTPDNQQTSPNMNKKIKIIVGIAIALVALIIVAVFFMQSGVKLSGDEDFVPIQIAYAQDNFEIEATKGDKYAVESDTAFTITSKQDVSLSDISGAIKVEPAVPVRVAEVEKNVFEVIPEEPLEAKEVYTVQIATASQNEAGGLDENVSSWAFQIKDTFKLVGTLPANKSTEVPVSTGIEFIFTAHGVKNIEEHFTITPHVEGRFETHDRTVVFVPNENLENGKIYTFTVNSSLSAEGYGEIGEDIIVSFETAVKSENKLINKNWLKDTIVDAKPGKTVAIPINKGYRAEVVEDDVVVYKFSSTEQFLEEVNRFTNIPSWTKQAKRNFSPNNNFIENVGSYKLTPQSFGNSNQYFHVLPDALDQGMYLIKTTPVLGEDTKHAQYVFLQVSDLNIFASVTETDTMFWVNDMETKQAIFNAKVFYKNNELAKTNSNGVALIDTNNFFPLNEKNIYEGEPIVYTNIENNGKQLVVPLRYDSYSDKRGEVEHDYWKHITTDRPIYRPNDVLKFWGFIKPKEGVERQNKIVVNISNTYYGFSKTNYNDLSEIAKVTVEPDSNGFFEGELTLKNVGTFRNSYYLNAQTESGLKLSSTFIRIKDFEKPPYTVSLEAEKPAYFVNKDSEINLNFSANFFEGTPVANLDFVYDSYQYKGSEVIKSDLEGKGKIRKEIVPRESCTYSSCINDRYISFNLRPQKGEISDVSTAAGTRVYFSDVHQKTSFLRPKKNETKSIVSTTVKFYNPDVYNNDDIEDDVDFRNGEVGAGLSVEGKVVQITHIKTESGSYYDFINKVTRKRYNYTKEEEDFAEINGTTDQNGRFNFELDTDPEKSYYVILRVKDRNGHVNQLRKYLYTQYDRGTSFRGNTDWFTLRHADEEKDFYNVGEIVSLDMYRRDEKMDVGQGSFLFYDLQGGLQGYTYSKNPNYQFVFEEKHKPAISVAGVWFDGDTYNIANDGWQTHNVKFNTELKKLNLEITSDKEVYKPGEEVSLSVLAKDANNSPISAEVNLALVDEAIFKLAYSFVNPLSSLYKNVSIGQISTIKSHKYSKISDLAAGAEMGCFLAGTQILLPNGETKSIEDVVVGDKVSTFLSDDSKELVTDEVVGLQKHIVFGYLIINNNLRVTPEHMIYVNGTWQQAGEIKVGDVLKDQNGQHVKVESIKYIAEEVEVYNFETNPHHTYIAEGVYVHNDKGGGAPESRSNFKDTAFFGTIKTNNRGEGTISFKLPDNITSWRVTAQAISTDLHAGKANLQIPATLPLFVDTQYSKEYVAGDIPTLRGTVYGRAVNKNTEILASISSEGLGIEEQINTKALNPFYLPIANKSLEPGNYDIDVRVSSDNYQDGVARPISVVKSRSVFTTEEPVEINENGNLPEVDNFGSVSLLFMDSGTGPLYRELAYLGCPCKGRIDRQLVWNTQQKIRNELFGEEIIESDLNLSVYQDNNGGVKLLPYADPDLRLSAHSARFANDTFELISLKDYFYRKFPKGTVREVAMAHYGLASLGEPVLVSLRSFADHQELGVEEKLYVGLAAALLGDDSMAQKMYEDVINNHGQEGEGLAKISLENISHAHTVELTGLAAMLASHNHDTQQAKKFRDYIKTKPSSDNLTLLERLDSIYTELKSRSPRPVSFSVDLNGKKESYTLEKGRVEKLSVQDSEYKDVKVLDINGDLEVIAKYEKQGVVDTTVQSSLAVDRKFYVNGKEVNSAKEGDIVEIRVTPKYDDLGSQGSYTYTEFLPSGLDYIERPYRFGKRESCYLYAYEENNQTLKFFLSKYRYYSCTGISSYFARVTHPGDFIVESPVIQSENNPQEVFQAKETSVFTIEPGE